jgi:S-adenosylmethionine hydrolase
MAIVTLLTDFGTRDGYVASMKGVIAGIAPQAQILDITHDIDPQNVAHAAHVLHQVLPWYPPNTVHIAVVDPGVGTKRRILVARVRGQLVVGPDNGLLSLLHLDGLIEEVHTLENRVLALPRVSNTFHGRDLMAPAGAHLVNGFPLAEVGPGDGSYRSVRFRSPEHDADGSCRGAWSIAIGLGI